MQPSESRKTPRSRIAAALTLFVVGVLAFTVSVAHYAGSQSIDDLKRRVIELSAIVDNLKEQAAAESSKDEPYLTEDLAYGDRSDEVRLLQKFLNTDPRTHIAAAGVGSAGAETRYFDIGTLNAVKRYQSIYRAEILAPAGLTEPTGYVGPRTRAHINAAVRTNTEQKDGQHSASPDFMSGLDSFSSGAASVDGVYVTNVSGQRARIGERARISGYGFTPEGNTVHIGATHTVANVSAPNSNNLAFTVPSNIEPGVYNVSVSNARGTSSDAAFFVAYEGTYDPPHVRRISPERGVYGTEITLHGSGFTEEGNQIRASYDVINDVPSPDGTTLTFKVEPAFEGTEIFAERSDLGLGQEIPFYFFVVNANGLSTEPIKFTWTL